MNEKNKKIAARIICLLFACFLLSAIELSARFLFPQKDNLSVILNVLKPDAALFWRLKPNLNTMFQGVNLKTDAWGFRVKDKGVKLKKDKDVVRIMCLGASPTFGWGIDVKEAYPAQLEKMLITRTGRKNIEVVNCGMIGYTSYQGVNFLKNEIIKFSPDVVTVSYGVNDLDKYRFYRNSRKSDREIGDENKPVVFLENIFERSRLFRALRKAVSEKKEQSISRPKDIRKLYSEKRRVSLQEYKDNLERIIDIADKNNIRLIFVKMKVGFPFDGVPVEESLEKATRRYIYDSFAFSEQGNYDNAISILNRAVKINPYSAKSFFYLGVNYSAKKMPDAGKKYFEKSKQMELFECAVLSCEYNRIMGESAEKYAIPIVDAAAMIDKVKQDSGQDLFLFPNHDFVHLNGLGHEFIGRDIADCIIEHKYLD